MKPNPSPEPEEDAAFPARLRHLALRPPPEAWRETILAAARAAPPARVRWYRPTFWRGVAALWAVLVFLKLDTWRLTPVPSSVTAGFPPVTTPPGQTDPGSFLLSQTGSAPAPFSSPPAMNTPFSDIIPGETRSAPPLRKRRRRRFVRSAIVVASLVTGFYVEENWRGARAWREVEAALVASHEPLTLARLFPPVPDEENFFAAPVVQDHLREGKDQSFTFKNPYGSLSEAGSAAGQDRANPDTPRALKYLRENAAWPLPAESGRPGADLLALLAPADAGLKALNEALLRPRARMLPWQTAFGVFNSIHQFFGETAQLYYLRSMAYLSEGRVEEAFGECVQLIRLCRCLSAKPATVQQLVITSIRFRGAVEMLRFAEGTFPLKVAQLQSLETELADVNFSGKYADALRGDRLFMLAYLESLGPYEAVPGGKVRFPPGARLFPSGWRLKWKATLCDEIQQVIDGIASRGFREQTGREIATGWYPPQPFAANFGNFGSKHHGEPYTWGWMEGVLMEDTLVASTRLAAAALRWRLEHGDTWPDSLTVLTAYFPAGLPGDPASGKPFSGAPSADGGFTISSGGGLGPDGKKGRQEWKLARPSGRPAAPPTKSP